VELHVAHPAKYVTEHNLQNFYVPLVKIYSSKTLEE